MENIRNRFFNIVLFVGALFLFVFPAFVGAEDFSRSYKYSSIDAQFQVNTDSTVSVTEKQIYEFKGEYHEGWRSISTKGTSQIDEIRVYDEDGRLLQFVSSELNKLDPSSWGKYTIKNRPGYVDVIWYYDARDESKSWTIVYKLHGAISFLKEIDELYWNVATEYTVPIDVVTASMTIPKNDFALDLFQASAYGESVEESKKEIVNNSYAFFSAYKISPQGKFTIAFGWPKGIIAQSAFWKDWSRLNLKYLLSFSVFIFTTLFLFIYWLFTEKFKKGKGTVIAQYEPPQNLKPAKAELIVTERITKESWPATVVDLAVRGYLKIEEEPLTFFDKYRISAVLKIFFLIAIFLIIFLTRDSELIPLYFMFFIIGIMLISSLFSKKQDYVVSLLKKNYLEDQEIEPYEKQFLSTLFSFDSERFSMRLMSYKAVRGESVSR